MDKTKNLDLKLLDPQDYFDEQTFNDNFGKIDDAFGNIGGGGALPQTAALSTQGITGGIGTATKKDEYVTNSEV